MTRFIALNFWILSKVIFAIDARQCERDVRWDLIQQLVYANLKNSSQLGLSGAGRYCGCNHGTAQPVCNETSNKTAVNLLYETSTGKVNANARQLASAERQLSYTDRVVSQVTIPTYYICSSLTVVTETDAEYKYCHPSGTSFTNHISPSGSAPSGKPGTATIVGAVVGSLAGLGLLAALARVIYGIVKKANQVDDSGSTSDISPIIPGFNGIDEAPNSVPPAGTH